MNTNKERLVVVVLSSEQLTFATFQTLPSDFKDKEELHTNLKKTNYVGELVKLLDADDVEYIWTEESMDKKKADIKEKEVYEQFLEKGYIYLGTKFREKTKPLVEGFTSHKSNEPESNQEKKSDNEIKHTYAVSNKLDEATNQACWEGTIDPKTLNDKHLHIKTNAKNKFIDYVSEQKRVFREYVKENKVIFLAVALTYCFILVLINFTPNNDKNTSSKVTSKPTSRRVTTTPNYTDTTEFKNKTKALIIASGFRCQTIDSIIEHNFSYGYSVVCNNYRYSYEIKDVGGNWIVKVAG